ncbi:hypothetical protein D3C83_131650 [compost metagenome]
MGNMNSGFVKTTVADVFVFGMARLKTLFVEGMACTLWSVPSEFMTFSVWPT